MRCVLVGADTLLLECAQALLARGHEVVAVVTDSARVASWATARGLPVVDGSTPADVWAPPLRAAGVDHLFAITHLRMLPASALAIPRGHAINFHDGPLPEYAGLNTPVWGLLHGEAEWGVTWHLIAEGVDTGDLLVQRRFAVTERETSLSLNTVNVEHALDTFNDLVERLERGTLAPTPQPADASRREYRRGQRPVGLLDWSATADNNDRLVRALHFGPHPNPVAAALVWHPHGSFVVDATAVLPTDDALASPGTVVAVDAASFDVACSHGVLRITALRSLSGVDTPIDAVARTWGLAPGVVLPMLPADEREGFAAAAHTALRAEAALLPVLRDLHPAEFPWPSTVAHAWTTALATVPVPFAAGTTPATAAAALAVVLTRLGRGEARHVALATSPAAGSTAALFDTAWPVDLTVDTTATPAEVVATVAAAVRARHPWLRDLVARTPGLAGAAHLANGLRLPLGLRLDADAAALPGCRLVLQPVADGWELAHDPATIATADALHFARCLALAAAGLAAADQPSAADRTVATIALLDDSERDEVLHDLNDTALAVAPSTVHHAIAQQAARTPHAAAVTGDGHTLSYAELLADATSLAAELRDHGVGPDVLVGVHVERGPNLLIATLAVLLAGGAYVPLDPAYPADRLRHMVGDSGAPVLLCEQRHLGALPLPAEGAPVTVVVDRPRAAIVSLPEAATAANHLAYCIYTSGSTGLPKGVLVEHRNVVNFFAAMDAVAPRTAEAGEQDRWFAVTSLSFDISVLELLYTLARGMHVVLHQPAERASVSAPRSPGAATSTGGMDFSLFYFSGDEAEDAQTGKYRLLLEGAKFADANGFCAVWTPERHFHAFGGLYPNPAITGAAVAAVTERVAIRAGSVVLPLHHPAEIAEAWSVVDNLSNGRVGVAFASGWQPNDFVFRPANYADAKQVMFDSIEQVRRLWRGERLTFEGPEGMAVELATLPRPVQPELPVWVTTAGNPETFAQAGAAGAHLLTHLLGQSVEQLAPKLAAYREARAAAGHDPATGTVTLMLHTFVGDDDDAVRATVREPLRNYLATAFNLVRDYAWSFPTFQRPDGSKATHVADLADDEIANLAPAELDAVLEYAFQRYYDTSGLFGTPERVAPLVAELQRIGVDEIACLLDFGVANDQVLAALPRLAEVVRQWTPESASAPLAADAQPAAAHVDTRSLGEQLRDAAPTHFQCTPSMARLLTADPVGRAALAKVPHVFVGGEALPPPLAVELRELVAAGTVRNMYGPTETTIWSSSWPLQPGFEWVPIGTPIANNQLYVLGTDLLPLPAGVTGDLWIGGDGVVRGYHGRPELTEQRFMTDPFRGAPHRMYFTGDLARWRRLDDGSTVMEFLGRSDHQVKLRGYRIELGEVEARLLAADGVAEAVAVVREDSGEQQLVAYVVGGQGGHLDPLGLRDHLRGELPEVMVPSHVIELKAMPHTPNGKIDRGALPPPRAAAARAHSAAAPASEIEREVLAVWREVLATDAISVDDNFFDIGGHSLLVVRLHRALQPRLGREVPLTDLYRFPTVRTFAASLAAESPEEPVAISAALDRAARRRANLRGRS